MKCIQPKDNSAKSRLFRFSPARLFGSTSLARGVILVGLVSFGAIALAFQVPYTYRVDVGSNRDRQFTSVGFHGAERIEWRTYRWTKGNAQVTLPALVGGKWDLTMTLNAAQPASPAPVRVRFANLQPIRINTGPKWNQYKVSVELPPGDATFTLSSRTYKPSEAIEGATNTRALGIRLDSFKLEPMDSGLREPPWLLYVLPLTALVILTFLLLWQLGFAYRLALLGAGLALLGSVLLVSSLRIYLNWALLRSFFVTISACLLFAFAKPFITRILARGGVETSRVGFAWLGLILSFSLLAKMAGEFYPQIFIVDAGFHLHRLQFVERGNLFFSIGSREFGGLQAVYPPALYILLAPLVPIVRDELALLKVFSIVLQTLGGLLVFFLARRLALNEIAALLATFIYLMVPIAFLVFSWGIYANVFIQELTLISLVAWFVLPWQSHRLAAVLVMSLLFLLSSLAHPSGLPLTLIFWSALLSTFAISRKQERSVIVATFAALAIAILTSVATYYSFFAEKTVADVSTIGTRIVAEESFQHVVGGALIDRGLGLTPTRVSSLPQLVSEGVLYLIREAWAYYRGIPVLAALVALGLMWRDERTRTQAVMIAAGLSTLVFFYVVGLTVNIYVRYMLFGLPFIALGAGYAIDRWQSWNRPARVLTALGAILLVHQSIWLWIARVMA